MNKDNRNPQIDITRGIAMLLVVLGHCHYSLNAPTNKIILSFHMPLFFILSGLVAKTNVVAKTKGSKFIITKLRTILFPQITLGIIVYIYDVLFKVLIKGAEIREVDFLYSFWRWWFLPVLFLTELLFYFSSMVLDFNKTSIKLIVLAITIIIAGISIYVIPFPDESPFFINVVPIAFFFYFIGYCLKSFMIEKLKEKKVTVRIAIMILSCILCVTTALLNTCVTMYNNKYGNIIFFLISSFSGLLFIWLISGFCTKISVLKWIGIYSLYIYVWQFKVTDFMKNIAEIICGKIHVSNEGIMVGVAFLLSIILLVPLVVLSDKIIPFMFGKKSFHNK